MRARVGRRAGAKPPPPPRTGLDLVGDLVAHTDNVSCLLACGPRRFVSLSADRLVAVWRDTHHAWRWRNEQAATLLRRETAAAVG